MPASAFNPDQFDPSLSASHDPLKLDSQICFPLYAASKEVVRLYRPFLDELDLTYTQYICMLALWERREASVGELGDLLYLDSGTLTPLLKKLEAKGYVSRARSHEDERKVVVALTETGAALRERAVGIPEALYRRTGLDRNDAEQLWTLLHKLLGLVRG